ncbi:hypothetical protein VTL71DRAFT_11955 [Oculimacula yallundae]|uniref:Uncharacterized protein n=1 Tax=Oculimacula yallundae TaxID=86028 RepID=A0ABR4CS63_9HELO
MGMDLEIPSRRPDDPRRSKTKLIIAHSTGNRLNQLRKKGNITFLTEPGLGLGLGLGPGISLLRTAITLRSLERFRRQQTTICIKLTRKFGKRDDNPGLNTNIILQIKNQERETWTLVIGI